MNNQITRVAAARIRTAIMNKLCSWDDGKPLLRLREPEQELMAFAIDNVLKLFLQADRKHDMKVVYIAHPISDDPAWNMVKIKDIVRCINLEQPDVVPFVPYYVDCLALDEHNIAERSRGIRNDTALIERNFIDECWCYGDFISNGMRAEIDLFNSMKVPVVFKSLKLQSLIQ